MMKETCANWSPCISIFPFDSKSQAQLKWEKQTALNQLDQTFLPKYPRFLSLMLSEDAGSYKFVL